MRKPSFLTRKINQGFIKFLTPPPVRGKFIKFVGEEYHVVKRGREYHVCGEEYNVGKWESGRKITLIPNNVNATGKNIKWGRGVGKKIKLDFFYSVLILGK